MKHKFKRLFWAIGIIFLFTIPSYAQEANLSDKQINDINFQIKETIDAFCKYLSYQSSHSFNINKDDDKKRLNRISNLFIESAKIAVSNKFTLDTVFYGYYKYLTVLLPGYHDKYKLVEIKAVPLDNKIINQLEPLYKSDKLIGYKGKIQYRQTFKGLGSYIMTGSNELPSKTNFKFVPDYSDTTLKEAEIEIRIVETSGGQDWIIKIGNIKVIDTKPYSKI